jgi:hypothetical protein
MKPTRLPTSGTGSEDQPSWSPDWQLGHQYVTRASPPCLKDAIGVPQARQACPPRP